MGMLPSRPSGVESAMVACALVLRRIGRRFKKALPEGRADACPPLTTAAPLRNPPTSAPPPEIPDPQRLIPVESDRAQLRCRQASDLSATWAHIAAQTGTGVIKYR